MPPIPSDLDRTMVGGPECVPGYILLSVIGSGGFGTVYQARQLKLDRVVAVKVMRIDPSSLAQFEAESRILGQLHHPHIVPIFDAGRLDDRAFFAMEWLDGEDFGRHLARVGKVDEATAWELARQVVAGLAHAAAHGIVHRDIKPANLFLVPAPTGFELPPGVPMVKVMDFGLAHRLGPPGETALEQSSVLTCGTPAYMAPEQHTNAAAVDHRADIFALGATIFHALTGRPPFPATTTGAIYEQKRTGPPRPELPLSAQSTALLGAMLAPDPHDRIGSYEELLARIQQMSRRPQPVYRRRWRRGAAVLAGMGMVILAASLWIVGMPTTTPDPTAYVRNGDDLALYEPESEQTWLPPKSGGQWKTELDDDKVRVLAGIDCTRRTYQPTQYYRLTLGIDVYKATAAEVHFGLLASAPDTGRRSVLRITRSDGARLGTRDGDRGPFQPLGANVPFPAPDWFEGRRGYLEVKLERGDAIWFAYFHGTLVGAIRDSGGPQAPILQLVADGGRVRVDSVTFVPLQRK